MDTKQQQIDVQNLKKHQEFWALKKTLEDFCDSLDDISDIDIETIKIEEIIGRRYASQKVRDLLSTLGLVDKSKARIIDRTGE